MGYKTATDFGKTFMKNAFKGLDGDKHVLFTFDEIKSLFYLLEGSKRKYKAPDRSLLYGHALACIKCVQEQSNVFSLYCHCFGSQ